jgi:putative drug exporter of the RND superfamily
MSMTGMLAKIVSNRPRTVLAAALALGVAAAVFGASTPRHLSSSDTEFQDRSSESFRTLDLLSRTSGVVPGPSILVVGTKAQASRAAAALRREPTIATVQPRAAVSPDGSYVLVTASFRVASRDQPGVARRLARTLPGVVGGTAVANDEVRTASERDLVRAELIAFPLLLLLALWVFRGLVAALLPLVAGVLSIVTTLAVLRVVNLATPISIFALNLVTGAGLGLAIDYSLLLVSRYREELVRCDDPAQALRVTLETAGRTVAFSAVTVAAAFGSLLVFPLGFLRSMALGGLVVAPLAGVVALTAVPALFALLGRRIDALAPARFRRAAELAARPGHEGGWYRFAHAVMRRPLPVALASAAVIVVLGLPALHIRFVGIDATVLPASASARQAEAALRAHFPAGADSPVHVAVRAPSAASTVAAVRGLPGVAAIAPPVRVAPRLWDVEVVPREGAMSGSAKDLVRAIRRLPDVAVSGRTAWYLDTSRSLLAHLPYALALLAATTMLLLFLVTRSFVLPVKAVVMNVLGVLAAFGILVFVFQDGRLERLLAYRSQGALELTEPVLLAAIAFGLATDYGVFLLARIREAHEAGLANREAVALGLERTGRVVTAAALLFCVAVGSFATSGVVIVKEVGIGIAVAVIIDASLVRALLVPSLMALLGDWNWWAPGRLRR